MTGLAHVLMTTLLVGMGQPAEPVFEKLGPPVRIKELPLAAVTHDPDGVDLAWGLLNVKGHSETKLVGVRLDNGATVIHDLSPYGASSSAVFPGADGHVYCYVGNPAHFFRVEAASRRLVDLGVPVKDSYYYNGEFRAKDGKAYIGTYPTTALAWVDTNTGEIGSLGRMSDDEKECYALSTAVADDGMIYTAVGLHHMELWAYNPQTREKRQILPAQFTALQGIPTVWLGVDGKVYGQAKDSKFLCQPDGIEMATPPATFYWPRPTSGDWTVGGINAHGALTLTHTKTGEKKLLPTTYEGRAAMVFSVACERDGLIYGSTALPGNMFTIDPKTGKLTDLGVITTGPLQVYDAISRPQGIFIATYMGCHIDLFRPDQPLQEGENPKYLGHAIGQERPMQWCVGPDGMLYTGTVPAKGRLGGAIMQIDPDKLTIHQFDNVIPNQSITYLEALPDAGLLFGATSVEGGSSAIATETEAVCFLWDCQAEKVVWQGKPIPGAKSYGRALRAANGLLYGVAQGKFYVLDPAKRETVATGDLPVRGLSFPTLNDTPVGPQGLIIGIGDGAVVALDPATNTARVLARHPSLSGAHGFMADSTGTLFYGSGTDLWRVKLPL